MVTGFRRYIYIGIGVLLMIQLFFISHYKNLADDYAVQLERTKIELVVREQNINLLNSEIQKQNQAIEMLEELNKQQNKEIEKANESIDKYNKWLKEYKNTTMASKNATSEEAIQWLKSKALQRQ